LRPEWLVWENVPGVLSADGGRAFGAFLGLLEKLGYGFAYRVLDAQYFGVPQRRRRVFVVGHFGDWRRAAAVLFDKESLCRNSPPSRKSREDVTGTLARRSTAGGGLGTDFDLGGGLVTYGLASGGPDLAHAQAGWLIAEPLTGRAYADRGSDANLIANTLAANSDTIGSLRAASGGSTRDLIAFSCKDHAQDAGDTSPTLRSMNEVDGHANGGGQVAVAFQTSQSGTSHEGASSAVRRLTPREAERLQGFPDDFTLVPYRKKMAADGPRYRALGNSMAVPVMRWIGERIAMVESEAEKRRVERVRALQSFEVSQSR
jgi:DNA (cytosine-5)-methyltransferase 1